MGEGEPVKKTMQSCLCTAQVRCDVVSFGTISVYIIQLVKEKTSVCIQASRELTRVLSAMCTEVFVQVSTAVWYAIKYCVTSLML